MGASHLRPVIGDFPHPVGGFTPVPARHLPAVSALRREPMSRIIAPTGAKRRGELWIAYVHALSAKSLELTMVRSNKSLAFELDQYGLTEAGFRRLGATLVDIKVRTVDSPDLYPGPARYRQLLTKSPEERRAGVHAWRVRQYERLCAKLSPYDFKTEYFNGDPIGVHVTVPAKEVRAILNLNCVDRLDILRIKGRRRKRRTKTSDPSWFAVKARFAIQDEGETRGMQDYEDRILLVQARSFKDAERKAMPEFRQYGMLSRTTTGHFWRWTFEAILDIYETDIDAIDPKGMEVYSEMKKRRMKPEYEWHPSDPEA